MICDPDDLLVQTFNSSNFEPGVPAGTTLRSNQVLASYIRGLQLLDLLTTSKPDFRLVQVVTEIIFANSESACEVAGCAERTDASRAPTNIWQRTTIFKR